MEAQSVWDEVQAERERAHAKHGDTSMESLPVDDLTRLTVLMEEVGEVARWFNENRLGRDLPNGELRAELIQVAAMAGAWADALTRRCCSECPFDDCRPPRLSCLRCGQEVSAPAQLDPPALVGVSASSLSGDTP